MLSGNKPLPEPMLCEVRDATEPQWLSDAMWCHWTESALAQVSGIVTSLSAKLLPEKNFNDIWVKILNILIQESAFCLVA